MSSTSNVTSEWRLGWPVALIALVGMALATSHTTVVGFFITPLEKELGWTRGQVSSGLFLNSLIGVTCAPLVGMLVDRVGVRKIALPGILFFASAYALMSTATPSILYWWGLWFLMAASAVFVKPHVWATAISKCFQAQRGLALAIMMCGSGITAAVLPLVSTGLIASFGWRGAYLAIGAGIAVIAFPLAFFLLRDELSEASAAARHSLRAALPGLDAREALLSSRFIRIAVCSIIMTTVNGGLLVHMPPYVMSKGLSATDAAAAASLIGICMICGRLLSGFALDRISNGPMIAAVAFLVPLVTLAKWLSYDGSFHAALLMAAALGLTLGAEFDIVAYFCSRYFGLRNYATIFGVIAGTFAFGAGAGPAIGGLVFDYAGSYDPALWCAIPAVILSAATIVTLGRYPKIPLPAQPNRQQQRSAATAVDGAAQGARLATDGPEVPSRTPGL